MLLLSSSSEMSPVDAETRPRPQTSNRSFEFAVVFKVLCIVGTLSGFSVSTCSGQTQPFSPVFAPNGSALCGTGSWYASTIYNTTLTACALNCFTSTGYSRCTSFNYDSSSLTCDVFNGGPLSLTVTGSCVIYLLAGNSLLAYDAQFATKNVADCSLPFTYNGALYYDCAPIPVNSSSITGNVGTCNQLACIADGKLANCLSVPGFRLVNTTQLITVPGPSGPAQSQTQTVKLPSVNGWLIVQQRLNSSLRFNQSWVAYANGFGNFTIDNSFWAGLDLISHLTLRQNYTRVRFEMFSVQSRSWYSAEYSSFSVGSNSSGYAMNISGYTGDAGDAMTSSGLGPGCQVNGRTFRTFDSPGTGSASSFAANHGGGWWYPMSCVTANLNGNYLIDNSIYNQTGMYWMSYPMGTGPANLLNGVIPGYLAVSRIMLRRP